MTRAATPGMARLKPSPDRLYGRQRTHALRPRQALLLAETLPRLRFTRPEDPSSGFAIRPQSVWLEVGFGGGEHLRALAAAYPNIGIVGCEVFEQGLCSLLAALVPEGGETTAPLPANLRVWDGDARVLLRAMPKQCLDRLYLMFPDPWPKARHAKRRFVHPGLIPLVASRLRPGAEWRLATDDPTYQAWVTDVMGGQTAFEVTPPTPQRPAEWPPTRYEAKALTAGRTPLYWVLRRR